MRAVAGRAAIVAVLLTFAASGPISSRAKGVDAGAWSQAPDLPEEHGAHTATRLLDGKVLIAGGADQIGVATAICELFDPKTNRWFRAASMSNARVGHAATLLSNGNVLVTGGKTGLGIFPVQTLASAEIYHPASNTWTPAASLHVARVFHSADRLGDGRVLVVGGMALTPASPIPAAQAELAEVYDPIGNSWSSAGSGLAVSSGGAASLMPDGTMLLTGGSTDTDFATTDVELFDPTTNRWQSTTPLVTPRYDHSATVLPDGRVLLVGGYTTEPQAVGGPIYPNAEPLTMPEIYDRHGKTLVKVSHSLIPRFEHTATLLRNGTVLVIGGVNVVNATAEILDPTSPTTWTSTGPPTERYLHTATLLVDGRVIIAGGFGGDSPTTAWIFSPLSATPSSSSASSIMQAAAVALVLVLVAFGFAATSGRLRQLRRRPTAGNDTRWIDP